MGRPRKNKDEAKAVPVESKEITPVSSNESVDMSAQMEEVNNELDLVRKELEESRKLILEMKVASSKRELDEKEVTLIDKGITRGNERAALGAKLEAQRAYDCELVTGRFINQKSPGQPAKLTYYKHPGDKEGWTTFQHNSIHTIPRGFADQINEHYAKITYNKVTDKENVALDHTPHRDQIYAFVPTTF